MSTQEKLQIIKSLFWDYEVNPEEAIPVLEGKGDHIGAISRHELFIKILNFVPWHKIREMFPESMLPELLSDQVINGLFPPVLRERYKYVRKLL